MFTKILHKLKKVCPQGEFYIVGGTTRDFILKREVKDIDIATNLLPEEIKLAFPNGNYTFEKYGVSYVTIDGQKITLATFREENNYRDFRHPTSIKFVSDYLIDSRRRDFTINALYLDENGSILDPYGGLDDIKLGLIRTIGPAEERIKEDPLRILRAIRFSLNLNFHLDSDLYQAIKKNKDLLKNLNEAKIQEEIAKTVPEKREEMKEYLFLLIGNSTSI